MTTEVRTIIDKMFEEFANQNIDGIVETFSDNAECIYHGTQIMPAAKFKGKEGVRMFFEFNINALRVVYFNKTQFIEEGNKVVVLGNEHFISNEDNSHIRNSWVQVYTVTNGLISRMEEFATSAQPEQYGGNAGEQ
ncbi:nuclear transport factor 2 family protein [Chryseobacterium limigenitum]|uniref:Ketosteroid isomerase-related protein n=1 Tax=Chryseobacterium limigenitum TaxID=1612149 RepID=A0A1K2IX36_9FLAO|nr:nuclear transport factor 2 family protein [Chryseobacterium limigenitum]SFZ96846.1 Ketosteroid isomerase-related protein [Chryseobacterium limigenitum]